MASQQQSRTTSFPANVDDVVSDPESLIRLLRAYDPAFDGAQAVRAAYEDALVRHHNDMMDHDLDDTDDHDHSQATFSRGLTGNALVDWVTTHISSDTLLSVDEMDQYATLERAGLLPHLEATLAQSGLKPSDPSKIPPLSDHQIRAATQELVRSTSLITRQTEALREQQDHLDRLVAEHKRDTQARAALEVQQLKGLEERQRDLVQSNEERKADVETLVDGMFHSDDHVLSSLQKLGDQLSRSCSGEDASKAEEDMVKSLRDICARMIKFHVEGIRTRLDRIYLETLHAAVESGAGDDGSTVTVEDVAAVQRELEELYTEILQSIDECLDYLLDRITTIRACLQEYLSYQQASPDSTSASHHRRHSSFPRQLPADSLSPEIKSILQTLGISIPTANKSATNSCPPRNQALKDAELEESVEVIRQELEKIEEWRGDIDGAVKASNADAKREQFLKRWGERLIILWVVFGPSLGGSHHGTALSADDDDITVSS
ncbi:hypothetical protein B0T13DRAFT_484518 [Neurospora crassa]|nr:hypothetical protein B0T13DRAFT_484518 [Neurospora crassa]